MYRANFVFAWNMTRTLKMIVSEYLEFRSTRQDAVRSKTIKRSSRNTQSPNYKIRQTNV